MGDVKFSILNAFYTKGKSAFAGSVEFGFPTASASIAQYAGLGGYFYATPALTYSYTINDQGLMMAFQPQYTFALSKNKKYPDLGVFTLRMFMAKFCQSGYFFVLEPRPVYDVVNNKFDFIISPIIGKSLGEGYNLIFIAEIPTAKDSFKNKGAIYQFVLSRSF